MRLVLQVLQQMYKMDMAKVYRFYYRSKWAKHEAVRSSWMDRTDIIVGTQSMVGARFVETLQPLTHYDENSKSVLFVQGGSVKADKRIKLAISLVAMGDIGIHTIQLLKRRTTV